MSLHRSLKTKSGALEAHRNVLTRPERIRKLTEDGKFDPEKNDPIHLPKVRSIKASTGKKKKAEGEAEGTTPAAGAAAPAAAAAPGKGAAPAAKGAAAPAGKAAPAAKPGGGKK